MQRKHDIYVGISSNFKLTSAMYAETEEALYSRVVILIKAGLNIQRFEDLRGRKACFPEFGGIGKFSLLSLTSPDFHPRFSFHCLR